MSFTNPIVTGAGPSNQSITEVTTDARHKIGTRGQTKDGRSFYYARSADAAALDPGKLVMSEVVAANNANINPSAAAAVGATSVAITLGGSSTYAVDAFEGGYLVVNDATGEGHSYPISRNTAVSAGTAITVTLEIPIHVALTTSSEVTLVKNPWADVVIAASGHVHMAAGIPQVAVGDGSSTTRYFWCQTWGICGGWDDAVTAIGASLQSGTAAGQIEVGDGAAQAIGVQLFTGVANEYYPKFLTIAP